MSDDPYEMKVLDYYAFGETIRAWASGETAKPETVADMIALTAAGGALEGVVRLGDAFQEPIMQDNRIDYFNAPDKKTISIILPHANDLSDPLPENYDLPAFYSTIFGGAVPTIEDPEAFRSKRIGDYAMRKCV